MIKYEVFSAEDVIEARELIVYIDATAETKTVFTRLSFNGSDLKRL